MPPRQARQVVPADIDPPTKRLIKIMQDNLETFKGNRIAAECNRFRDTMYSLIELNQFPTEQMRILYLNTKIGGVAEQWLTAWRLSNPDENITYAATLDAIYQEFFPIGEQSNAKDALKKIQQGSDDISNYNTKFVALQATAIDVPELDLIELYLDGLNPAISNSIKTYAITNRNRYGLQLTNVVQQALDLEEEIKRSTFKRGNTSIDVTLPSIQEDRCSRCNREGHSSSKCYSNSYFPEGSALEPNDLVLAKRQLKTDRELAKSKKLMKRVLS
jgi:Ty3 transposon capsid-like protein